MQSARRIGAALAVPALGLVALLVTASSFGQPAPAPSGSASSSGQAAPSAVPPPSGAPSGSAAPSASALPSTSGAPSASSAPPLASSAPPVSTIPPPFDPPFKPKPRPTVDTPPPAVVPASTAAPTPAPAKPEEASCCRAAVRFDPFDILQRRLSFQAELAIWGPFAIEIEPSWIFSSPSDNVTASGYSFLGSVGFYLTSKAPQGFFIKAVVGYESFTATVTNPDATALTASKDVASPILGAVLGSSTVFGRRWGFNISGSIGVGFTTAEPVDIVTPPKGSVPKFEFTYYDSPVQLLGSLGVGIGF